MRALQASITFIDKILILLLGFVAVFIPAFFIINRVLFDDVGMLWISTPTQEFVYPIDTNINAFDISVILNNAIENAFEGVSTCENPYVSLLSYRKKNAYMLEITNCISRSVEVDIETGLPETTKQDKINHGYGLINIRKVAQKYYGDIDIIQKEREFTLIVMLMID